jgi:sucrose-6-phosphate hydrolase SacC (GH32 family)
MDGNTKLMAPTIKYQGYWELPYLVPLDGRYVLMVGARNPYWIGRYDADEMEFTAETPVRQVDTGHYYAFNPHMADAKGPGGAQRRIMHGWATIGKPPAVEGVPWWEQAHSIPRVITITDDRLWKEPIPELQCLRRDGQTLGKQVIHADKAVPIPSLHGDSLEIVATFDGAGAERFGLIVRADNEGRGTKVWAAAGDGFGIEDLRHTNFQKAGEPVTLRLFVDRGVLEVYCNGVAITHKCFAGPDRVEVFAFSEGGTAVLTSLEAWKMKSIWSKAAK